MTMCGVWSHQWSGTSSLVDYGHQAILWLFVGEKVQETTAEHCPSLHRMLKEHSNFLPTSQALSLSLVLTVALVAASARWVREATVVLVTLKGLVRVWRL